MEKYLYRISTRHSSVWSKVEAKPIYFVANNKEAAKRWADENLNKDLEVSKIMKLAVLIANDIFVSE